MTTSILLENCKQAKMQHGASTAATDEELIQCSLFLPSPCTRGLVQSKQ